MAQKSDKVVSRGHWNLSSSTRLLTSVTDSVSSHGFGSLHTWLWSYSLVKYLCVVALTPSGSQTSLFGLSRSLRAKGRGIKVLFWIIFFVDPLSANEICRLSASLARKTIS